MGTYYMTYWAQAAASYDYSSSPDEPLGLPVELWLLDGLNT